jgi:hypothetical protein
MANLSFEDLIVPHSPERFFTEFWETENLCGGPLAQEQIAGLPSQADVDSLIYTLTLNDSDFISISNNSGVLPSTVYLSEDSVDMTAVQEAQKAGYTIQLSRLEKRWPTAGELARAIEHSFINHGHLLSERVGASLFLLPAHAGCELSKNEYGVFVIQLEGAGLCRISAADESGNTLQHEIENGNALFIPRGFTCEIATPETRSLYLSLYVRPYTWADLILRVAQADPRLRELLTEVNHGDSPADFIDRYQERVACLLGGVDVREVATDMLNDFMTKLDNLPDEGFRQIQDLDSIGLDTSVAKRSGAFTHVIRDTDDLCLRFPGSGFKASHSIEPVFRFLSEKNSFVVSQLPDVLSPESKLQLVRELVREGLLKTVG